MERVTQCDSATAYLLKKITKTMCVGFHTPDRLGEAEHNSSNKKSQLSDVECSDHLGRNLDMHRNVPTARLLAPQPTVREKTSATEEHHVK